MSKGKAHKRVILARKRQENPFFDMDILDCLLVLKDRFPHLLDLVLFFLGPDYFLSIDFIYLKRLFGISETLRRMHFSFIQHIKNKVINGKVGMVNNAKKRRITLLPKDKWTMRNRITRETNELIYQDFFKSKSWRNFLPPRYSRGLNLDSYFEDTLLFSDIFEIKKLN